MEYVLKTKNLTKQYGTFKALQELNMHVPKGAIYGFVGKNGAGKTTLIRLICGLQQPSSGEYTLYNRDSSDHRIVQARRRVGAVVETPSIYLDMSAQENLKQQYEILGLPADDSLNKMLTLVGLADVGEEKPEISHWECGSVWGLPLRWLEIQTF